MHGVYFFHMITWKTFSLPIETKYLENRYHNQFLKYIYTHTFNTHYFLWLYTLHKCETKAIWKGRSLICASDHHESSTETELNREKKKFLFGVKYDLKCAPENERFKSNATSRMTWTHCTFLVAEKTKAKFVCWLFCGYCCCVYTYCGLSWHHLTFYNYIFLALRQQTGASECSVG